MIDHKKVVFSYLNSPNYRIAKRMTREEAQKIVDKMDPAKVKKYVDLIKKWLKFFRIDFNKKNADIYDIIGKIGKKLNIGTLQLTALLLLFFGGIFPSYAGDPVVEETKIEQVIQVPDTETEEEKRSITEVRKELGKIFELPRGIVGLVKTMPQFTINMKGIDGFVKTVGNGLGKSITPEVAKLLDEISGDQWPEVLSSLVMQKIKADPKVDKKFKKFVKYHKTTDDIMEKNIEKVVTEKKTDIQKTVSKGLEKNQAKKAMAIRIATSIMMGVEARKRGYLIS